MRRFPWDLILAILVGFGVGLVYSWIVSPLRVTDAAPVALRADFKDSYRAAIAASYAATGNVSRAQARLSLLKDSKPIEALDAQAQRMLANGDSAEQADQVAALAMALDEGAGSVPTSIPNTVEEVNTVEVESTETLRPPPPDATLQLTVTETQATQGPAETQNVPVITTPRPTRTEVPTLSASFALIGQDSICDSNLPDGLLQVIVLNSNRRPMPGIKIIITWDGGEEQFFTGLKPELGDGYADYLMTSNVTFTIQIASGSDVATGITAPSCPASDGTNFLGGIKLTFQQS
jgi:hypothetical protein